MSTGEGYETWLAERVAHMDQRQAWRELEDQLDNWLLYPVASLATLPAAAEGVVTPYWPAYNKQLAPPGQAEGLVAYKTRIGCFRLLSKEQEEVLAQEYEQGVAAYLEIKQGQADEAARGLALNGMLAKRDLIGSIMRLAFSRTWKLYQPLQARGTRMEFDDALQEAGLGLEHAVKKFERTKGRLSTYAIWWIDQHVKREGDEQRALLHIPEASRDNGRRLWAVQGRLAVELGREPTADELTEALGWTTDTLEDALWTRAMTAMISLDEPLEFGEDASELARESALADGYTAEAFEATDTTVVRLRIIEVLGRLLEPKGLGIIVLRFGLGGETPKTLAEIGELFGVTGEAVRQQEARALRRLRDPSVAWLLRDLLG